MWPGRVGYLPGPWLGGDCGSVNGVDLLVVWVVLVVGEVVVVCVLESGVAWSVNLRREWYMRVSTWLKVTRLG
eukprot:5710609-Alexandrium_andersonii.AAC.1